MAPWLPNEVEAIVEVYFELLERELYELPVNKRDANRQLMKRLNGRSLGSVEFKHSNISAVLLELGCPYINGYKPLSNYQELLSEAVVKKLVLSSGFPLILKQGAEMPASPVAPASDLASIIVNPPAVDVAGPRSPAPAGRKPQVRLGVNYLELEAQNHSLGKAGEDYVVQVEQARLRNAGRPDLASRVEHVALTLGDGLGYDVLSFEESGESRPIEVKTTRFGPMTPFYVSPNEVRSSSELSNYHLYRVFHFGKAAKLFMLKGNLRERCQLEPTQYRATLI